MRFGTVYSSWHRRGFSKFPAGERAATLTFPRGWQSLWSFQRDKCTDASSSVILIKITEFAAGANKMFVWFGHRLSKILNFKPGPRQHWIFFKSVAKALISIAWKLHRCEFPRRFLKKSELESAANNRFFQLSAQNFLNSHCQTRRATTLDCFQSIPNAFLFLSWKIRLHRPFDNVSAGAKGRSVQAFPSTTSFPRNKWDTISNILIAEWAGQTSRLPHKQIINSIGSSKWSNVNIWEQIRCARRKRRRRTYANVF